jgi:hypothetical protein
MDRVAVPTAEGGDPSPHLALLHGGPAGVTFDMEAVLSQAVPVFRERGYEGAETLLLFDLYPGAFITMLDLQWSDDFKII